MTKERTRRLAAVWFADIVGYTRLSAKDEDAALAVVDELQEITLKVVEKSGGRVVKFMGDGVLSVFDSANTALSSALILQEAFHASEVATTHSCSLSVGVHLGEVVEASDGDIYGDGVNTAARIEGVARAGQVPGRQGRRARAALDCQTGCAQRRASERVPHSSTPASSGYAQGADRFEGRRQESMEECRR